MYERGKHSSHTETDVIGSHRLRRDLSTFHIQSFCCTSFSRVHPIFYSFVFFTHLSLPPAIVYILVPIKGVQCT